MDAQGLPFLKKTARRAAFGPARNRRLTNFLPVFLVRNRKKRYALPIKQTPCAPESEGAQSVPDMDKVVQMSRLFGVTTDFLLKDELSEEEDYTRENKAKSPVIGAVSGIYWLLVTAVYLFYTFGPMGNGQPKYSWFIWAVAGVLFGAVMLVVKLIARRK